LPTVTAISYIALMPIEYLVGLAVLFINWQEEEKKNFDSLIGVTILKHLDEQTGNEETTPKFIWKRWHKRYFRIVVFVVAIVLLYFYVFKVYSGIPQELGGMRPKEAVIWLSPNGTQNLANSPFGLNSHSFRASVVYRNQDKLLFRVENDSTKSIYEMRASDIWLIQWKS